MSNEYTDYFLVKKSRKDRTLSESQHKLTHLQLNIHTKTNHKLQILLTNRVYLRHPSKQYLHKRLRYMIQRLQTLFLFVAACLLGGQYFAPFANTTKQAESISAENVFADGMMTLSDSAIFMGFALIAALFCIIAIFRYQNRPQQISTVYIAIAGALISLVGMISTGYMDAQELPQGAGAQISWGGALSLAAVVCLFMAISYIKKDEALVRSMDRLR